MINRLYDNNDKRQDITCYNMFYNMSCTEAAFCLAERAQAPMFTTLLSVRQLDLFIMLKDISDAHTRGISKSLRSLGFFRADEIPNQYFFQEFLSPLL